MNLGIVVLLVGAVGMGGDASSTQPSKVNSRTLSNGLQVVVVSFAGSTNVSLFCFLPLGLASDGPGQTQWSHLIEHLVIRSTVPGNSPQANAETMPDHMRLDFYGHTGNWQEGLSHLRRWLEGIPFTQANLEAEKPKVIAECDFTAKNFATHKFALAAWSQGYWHGRTHVGLKSEVLSADLKDIQRYRDERLVVLDKITVVLVGGIEAMTFFAEAEKQLGNLMSPAKSSSHGKARGGNLDLTWDLEARHLLLTWPIPDGTHDDYASLLVAAQWLTMQFYTDTSLRQLTGMVLADANLSTPEGNFFCVSASLRPGATFDAVRKLIRAQVSRLTTDTSDLKGIGMLGQQLAVSLTQVPDLDTLMSQTPPQVSRALAEGNLGLQMGMNVHRYGAHREELATQLAKISASQMRQVTAKYLAEEECSMTMIRPDVESPKR